MKRTFLLVIAIAFIFAVAATISLGSIMSLSRVNQPVLGLLIFFFAAWLILVGILTPVILCHRRLFVFLWSNPIFLRLLGLSFLFILLVSGLIFFGVVFDRIVKILGTTPSFLLFIVYLSVAPLIVRLGLEKIVGTSQYLLPAYSFLLSLMAWLVFGSYEILGRVTIAWLPQTYEVQDPLFIVLGLVLSPVISVSAISVIAAIITAGLSLRNIHKHPELEGRRYAFVGLLLAVLFFIFATFVYGVWYWPILPILSLFRNPLTSVLPVRFP